MGNCFGSPQDYYLDPEARAEYERQVAQQKAARKQRNWFGKRHSPKTQPSESSKVDKDEDEDVNTLKEQQQESVPTKVLPKIPQ